MIKGYELLNYCSCTAKCDQQNPLIAHLDRQRRGSAAALGGEAGGLTASPDSPGCSRPKRSDNCCSLRSDQKDKYTPNYLVFWPPFSVY